MQTLKHTTTISAIQLWIICITLVHYSLKPTLVRPHKNQPCKCFEEGRFSDHVFRWETLNENIQSVSVWIQQECTAESISEQVSWLTPSWKLFTYPNLQSQPENIDIDLKTIPVNPTVASQCTATKTQHLCTQPPTHRGWCTSEYLLNGFISHLSGGESLQWHQRGVCPVS